MDSTEPDIINALTKESEEFEMKRWKIITSVHLPGTSIHIRLWLPNRYIGISAKKPVINVFYILTRSTFAGQQRAAATTWSGDIGADWSIYHRQISAGLNHCMAGIPYWTFDIGGFVIGAYGGVFSYGGKDPAYQELYTRMFQFEHSALFSDHMVRKPLVKYGNWRFCTNIVEI